MTRPSPIELRSAEPGDRSAILELLAASLQWEVDDAFAELFEWKHERSVFGASPAWIATCDHKVVALRSFLRWRFEHPDGRPRDAVRAVDTATHPDFQGQGLFRRLTLHAVSEMREAGVDFVFNTPNDQSRPGYLSMGWSVVGRVPISARVAGLGSAARMRGSRTPAGRWPEETTAGQPADEVLAEPAVERLMDRLPACRGLRTQRSRSYLRWRYGLRRLGYRVVAAPGGPADGLAVFRVRRRGRALEAALCELLTPVGGERDLLRAVTREAGADYVIRAGYSMHGGFVPLVRQGPLLTWRGLTNGNDSPALRDWDLSLGDVELL